MTKYLRISILVKPQLLSAKPQHFSTLLSLNPQFVLLFLVISLSSYFCGTKLLERCEWWRCLRGVWQVVRAACKPPDVSETSHWRRSRRAGGLQQQAERADYHGGLDAIRSPGRRQQIWHTPGLQDCPWEKVKGILYMHAETSWQWCGVRRQVLFPQSGILGLTILLAGVDAIRVVTIPARCHVTRTFVKVKTWDK